MPTIDVRDEIRDAIHAPQTTEVFLTLLTLSHPDWLTTIRLVNNNEDIVSNGETYTAFPFVGSWPAQVDNEIPKLKITVDNVSREVIDELRSTQTPPRISLQLVTGKNPDILEGAAISFDLVNIDYNAVTIEADLSNEDYHTEPFPYPRWTPDIVPGLFRRA